MRSSTIGIGCFILLSALAVIGGGAVALFLLIALHPLVELFPATSVASDVATGIAAMWGLVAAAIVTVYVFGSVRKYRQSGDSADGHWEDQRRFVPAVSPAIRQWREEIAAMPRPTMPRQSSPRPDRHFQAAPARHAAPLAGQVALESRLTKMEAMLESNLWLAERIGLVNEARQQLAPNARGDSVRPIVRGTPLVAAPRPRLVHSMAAPPMTCRTVQAR
jgi:hypothetical protein